MAPADQSASPGLEQYKQQAIHELAAAPVVATFVAVFASLAFLPVLSFALFAVGTVLIVGGSALLFAAGVISWLVGAAALLLVGTLAVIAFVSLFATACIGGAFALVRFVQIVKTADTLPDAIHEFQTEATTLLAGTSANFKGFDSANKVRFNGVVQQDGEEDVKLNDVKPHSLSNGTA
ncbi:hypothetical protein Rhopal_002663-T1 [Rhodotorula paludigena]|uniref:Uncharacterized protein n=1 Tax=Rhodotorula paludigena TaxID=86838 RepID=A0AAV5GB62_9BASI|nr:hypothetical protein Rhopal_002663-T1 [Rhodotorula paludigena]